MYNIISVLIIIGLIVVFHANKISASEINTNEIQSTNYKTIEDIPTKVKSDSNDIKQTNLVVEKNKKQQTTLSQNNSLLKQPNTSNDIKTQTDKQSIKNTKTSATNQSKTQNHIVKHSKPKQSSSIVKATKPQQLLHSKKATKVKKKPAKIKHKIYKNKKVIIPSKKKQNAVVKSTKLKTAHKGLPTKKAKSNGTKKLKAQTLSTTVKSKQSKAQIKKAKASKAVKVKVTPKTSKKTKTKSNYYNKAPKAWSSKIPGSDNVRDFGQTTSASGINDALKIMKASGNKGLTLEHTNAKSANIATIFNWNPTAKSLTYGTGTAIGNHTILTANHVINDQQAHKPMTPSSTQNLRINLLQEGSKIVRTLKVTGVKMSQYGDVALLYTDEDISKYMKIRKIANEKSITNIKANTPIHLYHYGLPTGKFKNDPMGTMYYSKGKYSLMARNVNPMGYYQIMAEPGSSGGAILNSKNEILGVHAFRIDSGDYKKYHLNTMAELRGKLRKDIINNIK
ncbi:trypsin-like serine protease [Staphylococcus gallinarum]|nr:trypsin-like serine protease [Staphylococcus gallinarum]